MKLKNTPYGIYPKIHFYDLLEAKNFYHYISTEGQILCISVQLGVLQSIVFL